MPICGPIRYANSSAFGSRVIVYLASRHGKFKFRTNRSIIVITKPDII